MGVLHAREQIELSSEYAITDKRQKHFNMHLYEDKRRIGLCFDVSLKITV